MHIYNIILCILLLHGFHLIPFKCLLFLTILQVGLQNMEPLFREQVSLGLELTLHISFEL